MMPGTGMVAGVETNNGLCLIRWVGRRGLSVKAILYCGNEANAADGVVQVSNRVLEDEAVPGVTQPLIRICRTCKAHL